LSGTTFGLLLGRAVFAPANETVLRAFRSAKISIREEGPSGFTMTFQAARSVLGVDYELLLLPYLQPFNRVALTLTILGIPVVLIDGLITSQELVPGSGHDPDTLMVTGLDVSVAMNMEELSIPWPEMPDSEIVTAILAKYVVPWGVVPMVTPTVVSPSNLVPDEVTQQQAGTDYDYIQQLAARSGYIFRIIPGPVPGANTAYFGPPNRLGIPAPTLNVGTFPERNVESIRFHYDGMKPETSMGAVLDVVDADDLPTPVASLPIPSLPPFVSRPAILVNQPWVRVKLNDISRMDPVLVEATLQGRTSRSQASVVEATGRLDVDRYGGLLVSPGLVNVRGAGLAHDGVYYVREVTHNVSTTQFTQDFTLAREGLGALLPVVPP